MRYPDGNTTDDNVRRAENFSVGETPEVQKEPQFSAILMPHRSLSPKGFLVLMAAVGTVGFVAGMAFAVAGAWPVFGFFMLNILLVYRAFRLNYRSGELYETIDVTTDTLTVTRMLPSGLERYWEFNPYWARCEISEHGGRVTELSLASHGRRLVFGGFLNADEKRDFAQALSGVLQGLRGGTGV